MMRDTGRRSPESSRRRRRERLNSIRAPTAAATASPSSYSYPHAHDVPMRARAASSSTFDSSSSTSESLLNISAPKPRRAGFFSFFRASSPPKRRTSLSKKKKKRFLAFGNSSSSSVDEGLVYGKGYVSKDRVSDLPAEHHHHHAHATDPSRPSPSRRVQSDDDILEIGRQLAKMAHDENREDLARLGRRPPSQLVATASALNRLRKHGTNDSIGRGIGLSKPHYKGSDEDSEWESASEDEDSFSEDAHSALAYGSNEVFPVVRRTSMKPPEEIRPPHRKSSVVDPKMFGPINSLRGLINTPCGFDDSYHYPPPRPSDANYVEGIPPASIGSQPLRTVCPVPMPEPNRYGDGRSSITSPQQRVVGRDSVPLQAPKPIAPVKKTVFEDEGLLESASRDSRRRSDSRSTAGVAAATGIAVTAVTATIALDRREARERDRAREERRTRDEKREREERHARDEEREREERRDAEERRERDERRRSKRTNVKIVDERDEKRPSRDAGKNEDQPEGTRSQVEVELEADRVKERRRQEKERERAASDFGRESRVRQDDSRKENRVEDSRKEIRTEDSRKEIRTEDSRKKIRTEDSRKEIRTEDSRKEIRTEDSRQEIRRLSNRETKLGDVSAIEAPVDPFQYQVGDDAFQTPKFSPTPKRPLTPNVVTVEREPDFSRFESLSFQESNERWSRKDAFEREQDANMVYDDTRHSTAPIEIQAIATAAAIVVISEREGKRARDPEDEPPTPKDKVQDDADRHYRETMMARKIAKEEPIIPIVTPPEMDRKPEKSRYEGPDADVRIDNKIYPDELVRFRLPDSLERGRQDSLAAAFTARDPSCERERPLLNLVYPTPAPTPTPEKQQETSTKSEPQPAKEGGPKGSEYSPTVVIGPKGEVIDTAKSSDGEPKEQKQTRQESEPQPEPRSAKKPKPKVGRKTGWGVIAAAVAGAAAGSAAADLAKDSTASPLKKESTDAEPERQRPKEPEQVGSPIERRAPAKPAISKALDGEIDDGPPPAPGPKPPSSRSTRMPGTFADDLDFAATVAAGLQDSGFDPNIVINDPSFPRRNSPPGSNEPRPSTVKEPRGPTAGKDEDDFESPTKRGKKEKRRQDKAAKRQDSEPQEFGPPPEQPEEPEVASSEPRLSKMEQKKRDRAAKAQLAQEEESQKDPADTQGDEWDDTPSKKKPKKSKKSGSVRDGEPELRRSETIDTIDDDWADISPSQQTKKSKKSSSSWDDEVAAADLDEAASSTVLERSQPTDTGEEEWAMTPSNKKKSKKSKKSDSARDDMRAAPLTEQQKTSVADQDEERDAPKKSRKSKRDSASQESPTPSSAPTEISVESSGRKRQKDRRKSEPIDQDSYRDNYDELERGDPPDKERDKREASEQAGQVDEYERQPNGHPLDDGSDDDDRKPTTEKPSKNGMFTGLLKGFTGTSKPGKETSQAEKGDDTKKENSFLGNADTLGASVGSEGVVAATASRSNATQAPSKAEPSNLPGDDSATAQRTLSTDIDLVDPEIAGSVIRPAIDPFFGDLLPLPPSEPGSPGPVLTDLPDLPESRPETPPTDEKSLLEELRSSRRPHFETPTKPQSETAIPIQFRVPPPSPGALKSSPLQSPVIPGSEAMQKRLMRPKSLDNTREIRPLKLLEHTRSSSQIELPLQQPFPGGSSSGEPQSIEAEICEGAASPLKFSRSANDLQINTAVANVPSTYDHRDFSETTSKPEMPLKSGDHAEASLSSSRAVGKALASDATELSPLTRHGESSVNAELEPTSKLPSLAGAVNILDMFLKGAYPPLEEAAAVEPIPKEHSSYLSHVASSSAKKSALEDAVHSNSTSTRQLREQSIPEKPDIASQIALAMAAGGLLAAVALEKERKALEASHDNAKVDAANAPEHEQPSYPEVNTAADTTTEIKQQTAETSAGGAAETKKGKKAKKNQRRSQVREPEEEVAAEAARDTGISENAEASQKDDEKSASVKERESELPPLERASSVSKKGKKKDKRFTFRELDELTKGDLANERRIGEEPPAATETPGAVAKIPEASSRELIAAAGIGEKTIERASQLELAKQVPDLEDVTPAADLAVEKNELVTELATQPAIEPNIESTTGPDVQSVTEAVARPAMEPVTKSITEPIAEHSTTPDPREATEAESMSRQELAEAPEFSFAPGKKGKKKRKGQKSEVWPPEAEPSQLPSAPEDAALVPDHADAATVEPSSTATGAEQESIPVGIRAAILDDVKAPSETEELPPPSGEPGQTRGESRGLETQSTERGAAHSGGSSADLAADVSASEDKSVDDTLPPVLNAPNLVPDHPVAGEQTTPESQPLQDSHVESTPAENSEQGTANALPIPAHKPLPYIQPDETSGTIAEEPRDNVNREEETRSKMGNPKKAKKRQGTQKDISNAQPAAPDSASPPLADRSESTVEPEETDTIGVKEADESPAAAVVESTSAEPVQPSQDDLWPEPGMKGKKGKKKKKPIPTFLPKDEDASKVTEDPPELEFGADDVPSAAKALATDDLPTADAFEEQPVVIRPSTKSQDKKKKNAASRSASRAKSSTEDGAEVAADAAAPIQEAPASAEPHDASLKSEGTEDISEEQVAVEQDAQTGDDMWGVPPKKGKKGKKRQSTVLGSADDRPTGSEAPPADAAAPEKLEEALAEHANSDPPKPEDSPELRKNKKGKKRQSVSFEGPRDDHTATEPTEVRTTEVRSEELPAIVEETPVSAEETLVPLVQEAPVVPADETLAPVDNTPAPDNNTVAPVNDTVAPVDDTPASVDDTPASLDDTPAPLDDTPVPLDDMPTPLGDTVAPLDVASATVEETPAPVEEVPTREKAVPPPVGQSSAPARETPTPVDAAQVSAEKSPAPVDLSRPISPVVPTESDVVAMAAPQQQVEPRNENPHLQDEPDRADNITHAAEKVGPLSPEMPGSPNMSGAHISPIDEATPHSQPFPNKAAEPFGETASPPEALEGGTQILSQAAEFHGFPDSEESVASVDSVPSSTDSRDSRRRVTVNLTSSKRRKAKSRASSRQLGDGSPAREPGETQTSAQDAGIQMEPVMDQPIVEEPAEMAEIPAPERLIPKDDKVPDEESSDTRALGKSKTDVTKKHKSVTFAADLDGSRGSERDTPTDEVPQPSAIPIEDATAHEPLQEVHSADTVSESSKASADDGEAPEKPHQSEVESVLPVPVPVPVPEEEFPEFASNKKPKKGKKKKRESVAWTEQEVQPEGSTGDDVAGPAINPDTLESLPIDSQTTQEETQTAEEASMTPVVDDSTALSDKPSTSDRPTSGHGLVDELSRESDVSKPENQSQLAEVEVGSKALDGDISESTQPAQVAEITADASEKAETIETSTTREEDESAEPSAFAAKKPKKDKKKKRDSKVLQQDEEPGSSSSKTPPNTESQGLSEGQPDEAIPAALDVTDVTGAADEASDFFPPKQSKKGKRKGKRMSQLNGTSELPSNDAPETRDAGAERELEPVQAAEDIVAEPNVSESAVPEAGPESPAVDPVSEDRVQLPQGSSALVPHDSEGILSLVTTPEVEMKDAMPVHEADSIEAGPAMESATESITEPVAEHSTTPEPQNATEPEPISSQEPMETPEFSSTPNKKGKKKKKAQKSEAWQPEAESSQPASDARETDLRQDGTSADAEGQEGTVQDAGEPGKPDLPKEQAEEPAVEAVFAEPVEAPVTQESTEAPISRELTGDAIPQEPAEAVVSQEPTEAAISQEPAEAPNSSSTPNKKGKKKAISQEPAEAPNSSFTPNKKGKKKKKGEKFEAWQPEAEPSQPASDARETDLQQGARDASETVKPDLLEEPVEESAVGAVSLESAEEAIVQEPAETYVSQRSTEAPISQELAEEAVLQEPAEAAISDKPAEVPIAQEPTEVASPETAEAAVSQRPTEAAVSQRPVQEAASQEAASHQEAASQEAASHQEAASQEAVSQEEAASQEAVSREEAASQEAASQEAASQEAASQEAVSREEAASQEAVSQEEAASQEAASQEAVSQEEAASQEAVSQEEAASQEAASQEAASQEPGVEATSQAPGMESVPTTSGMSKKKKKQGKKKSQILDLEETPPLEETLLEGIPQPDETAPPKEMLQPESGVESVPTTSGMSKKKKKQGKKKSQILDLEETPPLEETLLEGIPQPDETALPKGMLHSEQVPTETRQELEKQSRQLLKTPPTEVTHDNQPKERESASQDVPSQEVASQEATSQEVASQEAASQEPEVEAASQEAVSQEATSQEPGVEAASQEADSQEVASQEAISQEVASQEAISQEVASQEAVSQEVASQEAVSQEVASQEAASQEPEVEAASQEAVSQEATSQEPGVQAASQEATSQEVASQEAVSQEVASQEAVSQEVASQEAASQEPEVEAASQEAVSQEATSQEPGVQAASQEATSQEAVSQEVASQEATSQEPGMESVPITRNMSRKEKKQGKKKSRILDLGETPPLDETLLESMPQPDETAPPREMPQPEQVPTETQQEFEEQSRQLPETRSTEVTHDNQPKERESTESQGLPAVQGMSVIMDEEAPEFPIPRKKSKKRKGLKMTDSEPTSGTATPLQGETNSLLVLPAEDDIATAVIEPSTQVLDSSANVIDKNLATPDDFSEPPAQTSKKNKKRKGSKRTDSEPPSGSLTPADEEHTSAAIASRSETAPFVDEPQSIVTEKIDQDDEVRDVDSGNSTMKPKKKEKRRRQTSAFTTVIPEGPEIEHQEAGGKADESQAKNEVAKMALEAGDPGLEHPSAPESASREITHHTGDKDTEDDTEAAVLSAESSLQEVEAHPVTSGLLEDATNRDIERFTSPSPPTVGWGLMTRRDSDVFPSDGHVPRLLPLESSTPTTESSPEDVRELQPPQDLESLHWQPSEQPGEPNMTPTQESSNISHGLPSNSVTAPEEMETEDVPRPSIPAPESTPSRQEIVAAYMEERSREPTESASGLQTPTEPAEEPSFRLEASHPQYRPTARDIAASYFDKEAEEPEARRVTFQAPPDVHMHQVEDPDVPRSEPDESARDIAASLLYGTSYGRPDVRTVPELDDSQGEPVKKEPEAEEEDQQPSAHDIAASFMEHQSSVREDHSKDSEPAQVEAQFTPPPEAPSAREVAVSYLEESSETSSTSAKGKKTDQGNNKGKELEGSEVAAAASALTGGVALLAQKFGGPKKKTKGKGKKKIVDRRTPREEDMFDDPSLWEGADRKPLDGSRMDVDSGDFWNAPPEATLEDEHGASLRPSRSTDTGLESSDENGHRGGTELHHELSELSDDTDFVESPILGRRNSDRHRIRERKASPPAGSREPTPKGEDKLHRPVLPSPPRSKEPSAEPTSVLRSQVLDIGEQHTRYAEPVVDSYRSIPIPQSQEVSDFRRPLAGSPLPPVLEEGLEEEQETKRAPHILSTPEANRDSGFVAGSPHPHHRSHLDADESHRDSGVHLREGPEASPMSRDITRFSPEPRHAPRSLAEEGYETPTQSKSPRPSGRDLRRSPLGESTLKSATPLLREPAPQPHTPEPQKADRSSKQVSYKELGQAAGAGAALAGAVAAVAAAQRSVSDSSKEQRPEPRPESAARRSTSNTSLARLRTPEPLSFRPESPGSIRSFSGTPPLRAKRVSGDLRSLSQRGASAAAVVSAESADQSRAVLNSTPVANEGRVRARDMTDVYDGYGEGRVGSPRSPTRPHSMRRRQSMQVLELESRVDQLVAENRMLVEARAQAEQGLNQRAASSLAERDEQIDRLKSTVDFLQKEVTRLVEVNEGLNSAITSSALQHTERYRRLEAQHTETSRKLEQTRASNLGQHTQTLQEKDAEIEKLRKQLDETREQVRELQRQILATKTADVDFLTIHDEDYFDQRCQQLCSHVQQWVLRFSKFSDMRASRLTSELNDEKIIDRLDNAVLDGSDVDNYLSDRVRRRDIFISMTMYMIWEFVFTRYLFGMDREQRQKLKSLEKLLLEVGPPQAVRQWRAVTLTLLSQRPAFAEQRDKDTEAVVQAVIHTLSMILPPPSNLEDQIQSQLRRVMREAVDLSIEMRCQRAEYMMLPPLQPEYDANGDLAQTVPFNPTLMNERSGNQDNDSLAASGAVVRVVLFPLVVKKGDDNGVGVDEIVVCPAQVLVAGSDARGRRHVSRGVTPSSDAGGASLLHASSAITPSIMAPTNASNVSMADAGGDAGRPPPPPEAQYMEGGI